MTKTVVRPVTVRMLKRLGACKEQIDLFKELFGQSVVPTIHLAKKYHDRLHIFWFAIEVFDYGIEWSYFLKNRGVLVGSKKNCDLLEAIAFVTTWRKFRRKKVV